MKTDFKVTTNHALIVAAGLAVAYAVYKSSQGAKTAAKAVGRAVNPTSQDNLAYRGVNAIGTSITGDEHWTLGGAIFDWLNPDAFTKSIESRRTTGATAENYYEER